GRAGLSEVVAGRTPDPARDRPPRRSARGDHRCRDGCLPRHASGSDPAWSPDGRTVVFVQRHMLVLVGARGGHQRRLVAMLGAVHAPAWSPDGTTVAFASTSRAD